MEDEAKKLEKNDTLTQEEKRVLVKDKYYILFKPILYVLNKVEAITKMPQSPMEVWFHGKYGKFIEDMMVCNNILFQSALCSILRKSNQMVFLNFLTFPRANSDPKD